MIYMCDIETENMPQNKHREQTEVRDNLSPAEKTLETWNFNKVECVDAVLKILIIIFAGKTYQTHIIAPGRLYLYMSGGELQA